MKNVLFVILITIAMTTAATAAVPTVTVDPSYTTAWLSSGSVVVNLNGTVSGATSTVWAQYTGTAAAAYTIDPSGVSIANPTAINTTVTFTATGLYAIGLTGTNAEGSATDYLVIKVFAQGDSGFVGHWPLDGNTNDTSGSGNNGSVVGNPQYVDGQIGKAMLFDGVDDGVTITNESPFDIQYPMTLSCWIKMPVGARPDGVVVAKKDFLYYDPSSEKNKGVGWGFESSLARYEGVIWIGYSQAGDRHEVWPSFFDVLNDGDWHLYTAVTTFVYPGAGPTLILYIDGVQVGSIGLPLANALDFYQNDAKLSFGHTASFPGLKNWAGYLDDVRVYSYALSAGDVSNLFDVGAGCGDTPKNGDINGDCDVDLNDFTLLAQDWLECGMYYSQDCL